MAGSTKMPRKRLHSEDEMNDSGCAMMASQPCMTEVFKIEVRPLIDLIDKLREYGLDKDVSLPRIVVVGDQSSGKSSVLAALSGVQLPRGTGIVTRCPLELRMKTREGTGWQGRIAYQYDLGSVDSICTDPNEVEMLIRKAQDDIAGKDGGVNDTLIRFEIESSDVPDLTVVDLPGITRVAVTGQRCDASQKIKDMIEEYITQEQTIILAVVPANVDIATTEALQMAKNVDKDGKRTLGVVTKPDLVDSGSEQEMIQVVSNEKVHLKRGFTLVKCRGQKNIKDNMSLSDAILEEEAFFSDKRNSHFSHLPSELMGMKNLSKKLSKVLVEHIQESIPALKTEVNKKSEEVNFELARLGDKVPDDKDGQRLLLNSILQSFSDTMAKVTSGDLDFDLEKTMELNIFTKTRVAFGTFADSVKKLIPVKTDQKLMNEMRKQMKECRGQELPRFLNYKVFKQMTKEIISKFRPAAMQCLEVVSETVENIFEKVAHMAAQRFQDLEKAIKVKLFVIQEQLKETCKQKIREIFKMEELVYTQDRTFLETYDSAMNNKKFQMQYSQSSDISVIEQYEADVMFDMITSYMSVCQKRITDVIPMTISLIMVEEFAQSIRSEVLNLTAEQELSRLLSEDSDIRTKREKFRLKASRLRKAAKELKSF